MHCSAGIGRTGTLIAIYNLQQSVKKLIDYIKKSKWPLIEPIFSNPSFLSVFAAKDAFAQKPKLSVFGVVRRLREQRYLMVQTQSQYEFIYEYILQWLE